MGLNRLLASKSAMFNRHAFPLALFLLALCAHSRGAEVTILFRPLARADLVLKFVRDGGGAGWPEVVEFLTKIGEKPLSKFTDEELRQLSVAVYSNPRSWGHVALEFPVGYEPQRLGWVPEPTAPQMQEMAAFVRERPIVGGRFVDADGWKNDPLTPIPLQRIAMVDLTDAQVSTLRKRAESMSNGEWKYQLRSWGRGALDDQCVNCATAVKEVFQAIEYDLEFIPKSGSITEMEWGIEKAAGQRGTGSCDYFFLGLTKTLHLAK
jgi:hypothetical protein